MALSEDQKAILRLLAQRGEQGYEDLGALLGIGAGEVYAKAQGAAAELEAEGIPAPSIPAPPGASSTPPKAPVSKPEPAEREPVAKSDPEPQPEEPRAKTPRPAPSRRSGFELPSGKGARAGIAASVLVVLAVVLILVFSGGDSGDGGSAASPETAATETAQAAAESSPGLTQAVLSPVDGGEAEGRAIFGRVKKDVILQVQAEGLEPSPKGSAYTVWLYKSPQLALRIGSVNVTDSGGIAAQFPLPTELLAYIAGGAFNQIDLSLTETAAYQAEIAKARKENRLPAYTGEDVLRGPITGPALR